MSDVAFMESSRTKENRTGRMTRLSDIIVGRVLPGIRRRHEEFSELASSERSARDEREQPADEVGAAPARGRTPPRRSTADEGAGRRSIRIHDTAASPPRTAETHPRCPTPCVSAGPLGW